MCAPRSNMRVEACFERFVTREAAAREHHTTARTHFDIATLARDHRADDAPVLFDERGERRA